MKPLSEYFIHLRLIKLKTKYGEKFIKNKIENIKRILQDIDYKNNLSVNDYGKIRKIAISKGGFVLNSYRREYY